MSLKQEKEWDKKLLEDSLAAQEYVAGRYGVLANRCSGSAVKMTLLNLLGEEHRIQNDLLSEQLRRGWKEMPPAEKSETEQLWKEAQQRKKNAFQ